MWPPISSARRCALRRRRGDTGPHDAEPLPERVRGAHSRGTLHVARGLAGETADAGGRHQVDLRFGVQLAIIGLTFFMLINASALLVLAERKIMGFMQQRYGPYLVGPHGAAAARGHPQAPDEGGAAPEGRGQMALHAGADPVGHRRVRRVCHRPVGRRDDPLRAARRAGEPGRGRHQRRRPRRVRHHLDGRLRHRPRGMGVQQQVLADGRPGARRRR